MAGGWEGRGGAVSSITPRDVGCVGNSGMNSQLSSKLLAIRKGLKVGQRSTRARLHNPLLAELLDNRDTGNVMALAFD